MRISSADHEVSYSVNERFLGITMSRISEITGGLCGLVVGEFGPKFRQEVWSA